MKKHLLLFAALSLSFAGVFAQATWVSQATGFPNVSTGVFNVSVVDSNVVWISSYDGSGGAQNYRNFSRTFDGGQLWVADVVPAPAGHAWSQIFGLNDTTAWAVFYNAVAGATGQIWKTINGGVSWNQQGAGLIYNTPGISFPNFVHFWDENNGFAQGDPVASVFELYTTTDGGNTWVPVPSGNIPAPIAADEYGIVSHYQVIGDTIWFDTNKGRVFRSIDRGLNWTVSVTGLTIPAGGAFDIVFWSASEGLARHFNPANGVQNIRRTIDGGDTWTVTTATGNMLGGDIAYVPGTPSRLVSTGANPAYVIGSSYSDDGGLTWVDIEIGTQRTALGIYDINTMWAGGFTTSPISDGIFKYMIVPVVACNDPSVTLGSASATQTFICPGDTVQFDITGVVSPTVGAVSGLGWFISNADLMGDPNPVANPSVVAGYAVQNPAPSTSLRLYINDGVLIGGPVPYGLYYWTPVVFGNAVVQVPPGTFMTQLAFDPTCTFTGISIPVDVLPPGTPACLIGLADIRDNGFGILNLYPVPVSDKLNFNLRTVENGEVKISVTDITGRELISQVMTSVPGEKNVSLDVENLAAGLYHISATSSNNSAVVNFIKQ